MTFAEEFVPEGEEQQPEYPQAFGVTLTPTVSGIIIAILGLGAAIYLFTLIVQPAWQEYTTAKNDVDTKIAELEGKNPEELDARIEELEQEFAQTEEKQETVLSLFANEQTIDTLLLDINRFVESRQGQLVSFQPIEVEEEEEAIITDGSLGEGANNKLKRQSVTLQMDGTFDQTQSIMRSLERLQPILLVRNLRSSLTEPPALIYSDGQLATQGQPTITTTFRLDLLLPLSEEEQAELEQPAEGEEPAEGEAAQ